MRQGETKKHERKYTGIVSFFVDFNPFGFIDASSFIGGL